MIYKARYILPMNGRVIEDGELLVRDGMIAAVGKDISAANPDARVRDLGCCALLPGFVNAHSHIDYTMNRNAYDALNLWDWIDLIGFRSGKTPDYKTLLSSAILGAAECVLSGITCLGDSSFSGAAVSAMESVGLRGVVYLELFGQSAGEEYAERFYEKIEQVRDTQNRSSEKIKIGISPHTIYTSNPEMLKMCADTCANMNIPVSIHLAETLAEIEYTMQGTGPLAAWREKLGYGPMVSGKTPARHLQDIGLLKKGVCLAHCVHLDKEEVKIIAESGAGVVHCPRSNAFLGAGVAPVTDLVNAGAVMGIGTDSAASCMRLDFFDELRFALNIHRALAKDAGVITANDILKLATIGGAEVLGLSDKIGTLEPGKCADMVAVDMSSMLPGEDIALAVLSKSPADVKMVAVNGAEVVKDGGHTMVDVNMCRARLRENMGLLGIG